MHKNAVGLQNQKKEQAFKMDVVSHFCKLGARAAETY